MNPSPDSRSSFERSTKCRLRLCALRVQYSTTISATHSFLLATPLRPNQTTPPPAAAIYYARPSDHHHMQAHLRTVSSATRKIRQIAVVQAPPANSQLYLR